RPADLALRRGGETARLDELSLEEVEGLLVRKAMERYGGNVSHAARALGISRSALYRRLEKHGS
ncbi:MAG TPA: helix-turn-helix domain-containing protein, partial [Thermoanaerobaculia bacterium]|nr:helix-turn-helix domain-containing protein [Thermoanaerobaculia bacterium]